MKKAIINLYLDLSEEQLKELLEFYQQKRIAFYDATDVEPLCRLGSLENIESALEMK